MRCLALFAATACVASAAPPPPFWGPVWTAPFAQDITIHGFTWSNAVSWLYDSTTLPVGSSIYIHGQGQHDELCTSIKGYEFSEAPCTLLASNDTWRYVIFPQDNFCCKYCNTSDYCGIVAPDWLQTNASYVGPRTVGGSSCIGWMKQGGEQNYWYVLESDASTPCQYYEGYPTFDVGNNTWTFDTAAFSRAAIPPSTFQVPAGCDAMCDVTDVPYAARLAGSSLGRN